MNRPAQPAQPLQSDKGPHLMDEPDIGSGEKTPGEQETEDLIRTIPPLKPSSAGASEPAPR